MQNYDCGLEINFSQGIIINRLTLKHERLKRVTSLLPLVLMYQCNLRKFKQKITSMILVQQVLFCCYLIFTVLCTCTLCLDQRAVLNFNCIVLANQSEVSKSLVLHKFDKMNQLETFSQNRDYSVAAHMTDIDLLTYLPSCKFWYFSRHISFQDQT